MCFVFIWEQTANCATYSINWLVFITEMKSVYSAVRTGSLNKAVLWYSCTLSWPTTLEGGEGSASRPGRSLLPRKTRYPLYRGLGGLQGRSGQVWKISPPTGIRSPDRPASSQSLYRLGYPTLSHFMEPTISIGPYCEWNKFNVCPIIFHIRCIIFPSTTRGS
jgi:hypothetical protein